MKGATTKRGSIVTSVMMLTVSEIFAITSPFVEAIQSFFLTTSLPSGTDTSIVIFVNRYGEKSLTDANSVRDRS